jgi:hypothetical protein
MSDASPTRHAQPAALDEASSGPGDVERLKRAAQAANVLCEVLWEALHAELDARPQRQGVPSAKSASTQRAAELAHRLADIAATVALLAGADRRATAAPDPGLTATTPAPASAARAGAPARSEAVLLDERDEHAGERGPALTAGASTRSHQARLKPRPRPWDAASDERSGVAHTSAEEEMNGEDHRDDPAAQINLIASALERFEGDRLPFAVLLIEVSALGPLRRGLPLAELPRLVRQIESASTRALEAIGAPSAASLALESPARLWLQVPETDRLGARTLVERLLSAMEAARPVADGADPAGRYFAALSAHTPPSWARQKDARLELAIGTAVCPVDGEDIVALVKHASVELAAMRGVKRPSVALAEPS